MIPEPPHGARYYRGKGLEGAPVGLATNGSGRVWVLIAAVDQLYRFDRATEQWGTIPLPAAPDAHSSIARLSGEHLAFNAPATTRMDNEQDDVYLVDTGAGRARRTGIDGWSFADAGVDAVLAVDWNHQDRRAAVGVWDVVSGRRLRLLGTAQVGGLAGSWWHPAVGDDRAFVLATGSEMLEVVSYSIEGATSERVPFPIEMYEPSSGRCAQPNCPQAPSRSEAVPPVISSMIVDERGDLWVLTGGLPYPDLYRLDR